MVFRRKRKVTLTEDEIGALEALSFIVDQEADNVERVAPDAPASDVSQMSLDDGDMSDGVPTIANILRAVANYIRYLINRITML